MATLYLSEKATQCEPGYFLALSFPSYRLSEDPKTGFVRRHHIDETTLRKSVKSAAINTEIERNVTCHMLCGSFSTHLLQRGADIRTV